MTTFNHSLWLALLTAGATLTACGGGGGGNDSAGPDNSSKSAGSV